MPPRWTNDNAPQASAFHELVVLPTLAPHLARSRPAPGSPAALPVRASESSVNSGGPQDVVNDSVAVPAAPLAPEDPQAPASGPSSDSSHPERSFFVFVTLQWSENIASGRSTRKVVKDETKQAPEQLAVLDLTRAAFVVAALEAHGYQDRYAPGALSGPSMKIFWPQFPGGKASAPTIRTDQEWDAMVKLLRIKHAVTSITAVLDVDKMEGYRTRKRALSPDIGESSPAELVFGTRVPSVGSYSAQQRQLAEAASAIKAAWSCASHGTCYIDTDTKHVQISTLRLKQWASAVLASGDVSAAVDPPPGELLTQWGHAPASTAPKARGRAGPSGASASTSVGASADPSALLVSAVLPFVTMAMQTMQQQLHPATTPHPPRAALAQSDDDIFNSDRASSPLPPIEDELAACLEEFGRVKAVSAASIAAAVEGLRDAGFSPDTLDGPSVARIQELTGLPEGRAYQLQKYANIWSGKIDCKRAKRARV